MTRSTFHGPAVLLVVMLLGCPPSGSDTYPCSDDRACASDQFCQGETDTDEGVCVPGADEDGDDSAAGDDCDDGDAAVYPGADELCDGKDNDCDSATDAEGGEADTDGDGYLGCTGCEVEGLLCDDCDDNDPTANGEDADGDGVSTCDNDCDDNDDDNYPGNTEVCDGQDNDCTGAAAADEADGDTDGYMVCEGDCDDTDAAVSPGGDEVCGNAVDEDCDGREERCWLDVAVTEGVTCGITEQGAALCWGWDDWVEDLEDEPAGPFESIAISRSRKACALRTDGSVTCWDDDGTTYEDATGPFESVCAADYFACGLDEGGMVNCWPEAHTMDHSVPSVPLETFDCLANQGCGVASDGSIRCWGDDGYGTITEAPTAADYAVASSSPDAACAVRTDGEAECWSELNVWEDVVPPAGPFCTIDVSTSGGGGVGPVCAVRGDPLSPCSGTVQCWSDSIGASPPAGQDFTKGVVAWGATFGGDPGPHACGLTPAGLIRCWAGVAGPQLDPPTL